jgi:redox-sensitive bicupin YhaK (pirin superfamily)
MSLRAVKEIYQTKPTIEGAGVKLQRAFGFGKDQRVRSLSSCSTTSATRIPEDYLAGFPWHPHRGIETITYVLAGEVQHGDSLGNKGRMTAGDVQWMTAGSGILHQEMPKGDERGRMHGFQLWANLPASLKMTDPRYQDIPSAAIPEVTEDDGTRARIICGEFWGKTGPVEGVAGRSALRRHLRPALQAQSASRLRPRAMLSPTSSLAQEPSAMHRLRGPCSPSRLSTPTRSRSTTRKTIRSCSSIAATKSRSRPDPRASASCSSPASRIEEPVAWYGPIVMNTQENYELRTRGHDRTPNRPLHQLTRKRSLVRIQSCLPYLSGI